MQGRIAVRIDGRHDIPKLDHELHRLQRFFAGPRTLVRPHRHARSHKQRCRAVLVGQHRISAKVKQQIHQFQIDDLGRQKKRRRINAVQHIAVSVARFLCLPRIDIRSSCNQCLDQLQICHPSARQWGWIVLVLVGIRPTGPDQLM